jgi:serine/threonine-protein kinase
MSVAPGSRLGPYEITAKLGEGGMGEVYRATDSKLRREVAIKVLPAAFTADPERLARFEREAQLLAQLHHPNIASIFGLEESGGERALVMELVEGPTLAERMEQGALPLEESLAIARGIAEALEAAHEKGIVHRDLKPQNVKLAPGGTVKVLDFGLAKAMDAAAGSVAAADLARSPTMMNSPTVTAMQGTQLGVILGTAAYMAPEQARGGMVDKRADIWAFGVVLHEMLTGRSLFGGDTISDTLAGVLKSEIDWKALPAGTPPALRQLLRRCLERNPRNRLHDIADARIVIEEIASGKADDLPEAPPAGPARRGVSPVLWVAGVIAALAAGLAGGRLLSRGATPDEPEVRLPIALPSDWKYADADTPLVAISRDGRRRAVAAAKEDGRTGLLVSELSEVDWRELPGTSGATSPFFAPDGNWIGYFGPDKLMRVAFDGGPPLPVAEKTGIQTRGAVWLADGSIVYSPEAVSALWRIPAAGGAAQPLTELDAKANERTHRWPDALPDGSAVLFTVDTTATTEFYDDADIDAVVVATGERRKLLRGASAARYLDPGVLLFARGGTLFAVRFDASKLTTEGSPVPVQQQVATTVSSGAAQFAVSSSGALLWAPGEAQMTGAQPVWLDRQGTRTPAATTAGNNMQLELAPDGRRLALATNVSGAIDLWIVDLETGSRSRLTFDGDVSDPTWSADGRRVAYLRSGGAVGGGSDLYWKLADGTGEAEPLVTGPEIVYSGSFSPDGRYFLYDRTAVGGDGDIWYITLDAERRQRPFVATEALEIGGRFSPDGRWVAYSAQLGGQNEIFVRPFPPGSGHWQISSSGGIEPHWSRDGRELYYRNRGSLFVVKVDTRRGFAPASPERIAGGLRSGDNLRTYWPAPDGTRFIALPGWEVSRDTAQVNLALHWDREVRRRLAGEH